MFGSRSDRRRLRQTSGSNRLLRLLTGAIAGIFVLTGSQFVALGSRPALASFYGAYVSRDMQTHTVKFAGWICDLHRTSCDWGTTYRGDMVEKNKTYQIIKIPRAYIWRALPFSRGWKTNFFYARDVPDPLITGALYIRATMPDMAPLSLTTGDWRRQHPGRLRHLSVSAVIRTTGHGVDSRVAIQKGVASMRKKNPVGGHLGYDSVSNAGSTYYYLSENDPDEISIVSCYRPPEKAKKHVFCTYRFPLNSKLSAELTFVDFRANGGVPFMRKRVRAFKRKFCPIFNCDLLAWNGAEL